MRNSVIGQSQFTPVSELCAYVNFGNYLRVCILECD